MLIAPYELSVPRGETWNFHALECHSVIIISLYHYFCY
jgi:hypothetical protein